jgi:7-cyano-7-deazaguanine synthase
VVLLSGGLDSATVLAMARAEGAECHCLSVDYGQRHRCELEAARAVGVSLGAASHRVVGLDLRTIGGSALTDEIDVPRVPAGEPGGAEIGAQIPMTYVPARNMVFLALAIGLAEVVGAGEVHVGVNAVDYSGYPDCRPEFIEAMARAAAVGTRAGVEGRPVDIRSPLAALSKAEIIRAGAALGVDYGPTVSCYDPDGAGGACGSCEACVLRRRGFAEAGAPDPTRYRT